MEFKPSVVRFKKVVFGLAIVFFGFAAAKIVLRHDLHNGLWSLAVSAALFLNVVPAWLTGHRLPAEAGAAKPDPASKLRTV